mmetsp:Transcript_44527/g.146004  ORF Transcript_44527/g.146004 Transcript_44527/m.146004 type:complete len:129 (-) Transcript_44527:351-737(-)
MSPSPPPSAAIVRMSARTQAGAGRGSRYLCRISIVLSQRRSATGNRRARARANSGAASSSVSTITEAAAAPLAEWCTRGQLCTPAPAAAKSGVHFATPHLVSDRDDRPTREERAGRQQRRQAQRLVGG